MSTSCGYIALLGRPNAGKSTLLNALCGYKLAGVSAKPQTTRHRILGSVTTERAQYLFLDSPGIHLAKNYGTLNKMMVKQSLAVMNEADVVLYLISCHQGLQPEDDELLAKIHHEAPAHASLRLLISQADRIPRKKLESFTTELRERYAHLSRFETMSVSAKRRQEVDALLTSLAPHLPASPFLYPEDHLTESSDGFIITEHIREALFRQLGNELPYQATAVVENLQFTKQLVTIEAVIKVARESQKGMVVGKGGSKIKAIGSHARLGLEKFFGCQVNLQLMVNVETDWHRNERQLAQLMRESSAGGGLEW